VGETEIANVDATRWRSDPDVLTMERLRDGETDAFQVLFSKYHDAIARFADRFLHSSDRADEVAQTVFLRLFHARRRYRPTARFTTFLYRIATNVCLNEIRRFDRSKEFESLDAKTAGGSSFLDQVVDASSPGPVQWLVCREAATEMIEVLERLPSKQRRALLLKRVEGYSLRDVADSLETSTDAVKSLIFRATATLRRELAE
jgi:RNA polymerase sigma-70 factor, ECF subfamily